ncbi:MAG: bifunctional pyr operon transcriptional regulator/uracil phosphoribosyltransferase PyrR [Bdellovibrio sp.]|nr:bifunctional pyr operon transcriptional regulator/uracil phosphoribosyltransferase PyrR [Methylotenera sp.]
MTLPNPETLLADISAQIKMQIESLGAANCALVGIHSGGVWLMDSLLKSLKSEIGLAIESGTLDAAMYRDDYNQRGLKAEPKPANISFDITDKHIILIDDIFYTGRTTRAAMNELFDYGRPASITLAVLINRGGAELPIAPNICGANVALTANQSLQLSIDTKNKLHLTLEAANV